MKYAFLPPAFNTLEIIGKSERFPINRIFCVGRNYAAHTREMGFDPDREAPFFFMKPASAVVEIRDNHAAIPYPPMTNNFHHEIELVVAVGPGESRDISGKSNTQVYGYAIGLDMTRRDLQLDARNKGRPWEFGKSLSGSALIGPVHPVGLTGQIKEAKIALAVNGIIRQRANINELIWSIPEIIEHLSPYEPLQPGDLIMTGTPEGVGPVAPGDVMHGVIDGLGEITVTITRNPS